MRLLILLVLLAPQESQVRLKAGQEKIKVRDFDGAIPELEKCLALDPDEFNASFGLGICLWEKEEYKASRRHFRRVVEVVERRTPGAALTTVHQKLLGCALLLEDFDDAVTEATILLQTQERGEYFYDRALARHRKGDLNGALDDCVAALREDGQMAKARILQASIVLAKGDATTALDGYAAALQSKPSDPSIPLAKGCSLLLLGRDAEALVEFRASLKANQGLSSDLELRAVTLALVWLGETRAGRPAAAEEAIQAWPGELKELGREPRKNHLLGLPLYLGGSLPEAELLKAAEGAVCRPAQARCEAWLYIAERRLAGGNKAGAREAWRACVAAGARGIFEHDLAERRLKAYPD
ncbi:MAG TPA: tetratricopeptide repeat protein [Planctomycetota bacterium]|nr:tetratricopeptide repeat protein [Planctomycetota bacterium]